MPVQRQFGFIYKGGDIQTLAPFPVATNIRYRLA